MKPWEKYQTPQEDASSAPWTKYGGENVPKTDAMPGFNVEEARKAGYGDDEILQYLTQSRKFDVDGALKAGYSKPEIIAHLSSAPAAADGGAPAPAGSTPITPWQATKAIVGTAQDMIQGEGEKVWKGVGNTASALKDMAVQAITPPTTPEEKIASSFGPLGRPILSIGKGLLQAGDVFHQQLRGGDVGGAAKTAVEQLPGGRPLMRGDASEAIGEAGSALLLPKLAKKLPAVVKVAGEIPRMAGDATKTVATEVLGKTTGVGSTVMRRAIENPSADLTKAMRGGTTELEVVENFRDALRNVKDARSEAYQQKLGQLTMRGGGTELNIEPVRRSLAENLKKFNIKTDPEGGLDFSRSTVRDPSAQAEVRSVYSDVATWGDAPGDLTPHGVDILKRRIDDTYSPSSTARAIVQSVKDSTRQLLNTKVPGYSEMTKEYAEASKFLDQLKDLSLESKNPGTAVRKLTTLLNQNNGYRQILAERLSEFTPKDLEGELAGLSLSKWAPRGIAGPASGAGLIYGVATHAMSPIAAVALAATSPRLMGELLTMVAKKPARAMTAVAEVAEVPPTPRIAGLLPPATTRMGPIPDESGIVPGGGSRPGMGMPMSEGQPLPAQGRTWGTPLVDQIPGLTNEQLKAASETLTTKKELRLVKQEIVRRQAAGTYPYFQELPSEGGGVPHPSE